MQFFFYMTIKSQPLEDFFVESPTPRVMKLYEDLPDEVNEALATLTTPDNHVWQLYFDRASQTELDGWVVTGVGVLLMSP